ncbi:MAG TPA: DsbA family protein [Steroidobacteraceae bacterium]|nr:DsbA family protein [Steroidobacteraceae bacterium]
MAARSVRVSVLGIALALLLGSVAAAAQQLPADRAVLARANALWHDPASPVLGNPHGDVTIVEFFDYACPYCKAVEPRVAALLESDGHVRLILKEFPILTPESLIATRAALAAAKQGKYAQFHRALMAYRGPWESSVIFEVAREVGLNNARLRRDMAAPEVANEIIANFNLARALRLFQTPSFIVGSHILTMPSAQIDFPREVAAARAQ